MSQESKKIQSTSSTITCQNKGISKYCSGEFVIEPEDFVFYEKIKVPPPTFCPECRFQRRLSFMNVYSLYKAICAKCDKSIISMFHQDSGKKVFCSKCWWADDWDGTEYAMDYDPSKNFFEQFQELKNKTPFMALDTLYSSLVNTSYTNYSSYLKNGYGLFFADYAEDSFYCDFVNTIKDTMDCSRVLESELCYDCVGMNKSFKCIGSLECENSVNLVFSKNCANCNDCFGCVNLRQKSYCIFNKQYTKEEYFDFLNKVNLSSFSNYQKYKKESEDFWISGPVRNFYGNSLNQDVSGDYVYESKNAHDVYMVTSVEDSKYVQMISVPSTKDSYDYTCWGGNAERIYESLIAGHGAYDVKFSMGCYPNPFSNEYCYYASSCKHVFGCVNLKKKQYCILNKSYSKEEYENLKKQIIEDMNNNPFVDNKGRVYKYGEFFPTEISSFGYNESEANEYFTYNLNTVNEAGFSWKDYSSNEYNHTIEAKDLPDLLFENLNILKEVVKCECGRCFKISTGELELLNKINLPIPRNCPECRRISRHNKTLKPKFYKRNCGKCNKDIVTSYSPDRPEIVYCEKCYQQEVY
jgi:hypothetical protein